MFLFKPKVPKIEDQEEKKEEPQEEKQEQVNNSASALSAEIIKLKAQFDQFSELRKVINERFTRINEQIGELRGMIMDTNRSMQDVEIKTVKAVDLVEAVHPDKLMVEVRKQDAKIESLKAGIESNDSIMKSLMEQLKDMRHEVSTFRGIDQVVKLNEEVKKELMDIKKIEATVERHSDKIEGIFIETQKKFQEFDSLNDKFKELQRQVSSLLEISDQTKVKLATTATKKEVEDLINKFNDFEKHVGNIIDLLTKRTDDSLKDIDERFKRLEKSMNDAFDKRLKKAELFNQLIEKIEKDAPRIAKELQLSEKLKDVEIKKIESQPSQDIKENVEKVNEEKKGFFARLFAKKEEKK
ncbi:MAG: hypothetical protein QXM96_00330 [Candidatus Woesearchaeota archaeon]